MATQQQRRQLSIQEERVGKAASELEKARVESNKMQDALEGKQKVLQEKEDQLKKVQEEAARKEQEATEASQLLARKVDELQQLDDEKRRAEELLREMTIKRDTAAQARETAAKELEAMEKQQLVKTQAREAKEAEVNTQQELIEQLQGQLVELREKILDFEGKERKLNEERARIDVRLQGIQQARVQLNCDMASVKEALKAQQEKQRQLEAEKQKCECDVQAKKHRLNDAQVRLYALQGVMQEAREYIEAIVQEKRAYEADIQDLQQKHLEAREAKAAAERAQEQQGFAVAQGEQVAAQAAQQHEAQRAKVGAAAAAEKAAGDKASEASGQHIQCKEDLDKKIRWLEERRENLAQRIQALDQKIADREKAAGTKARREGDLQKAEEEERRAKEEKKRLEAKRNWLQKIFDALTRILGILTKLAVLVGKCAGFLGVAVQVFNLCVNLVQQAEGNKNEADREAANADAAKQRADFAEAAARNALQNARHHLQGAMQGHAEATAAEQRAQQNLDAKILGLQQLQQGLERNRQARAIAWEHLERTAKAIAVAEGKRNALRVSAEDRARQKEKVEAEIKEVLADKHKLEDEVVNRQHEIDVVCQKLSSLDAQLTRSKDQLRVLEGGMAEADAMEVDLKDQQVTLSSKKDECEKDLSKCRAEERRATDNVDRATQKEDELKKELRSLTGEIKLGAEDVAKKRGVLERADSAAHQLAEQVSIQNKAREDVMTRQKAANAEKLTLDEQSKGCAAKAQQLRGQAESLKNEAAEAKRAWEAADEAYKGQKSNVLKMENKMRTLTEERDKLSHIVNAVAADVAPASLIADHQVDECVEHNHIRQPQFN